MEFEQGHEKIGGRKAGTPNRKTLLRASAVLAERGLSPTDELIKIAQDLETKTATCIEIWKFLQSFVEAPQTIAQSIAPDSPSDSVENARAALARLNELSKPLEPTTLKP